MYGSDDDLVAAVAYLPATGLNHPDLEIIQYQLALPDTHPACITTDDLYGAGMHITWSPSCSDALDRTHGKLGRQPPKCL